MNFRQGLGLLGSACIGAGVMFLSDPRMGRRRRALLRDQVTSVNKRMRRFITHRSEDVKHRAHGLYCEVMNFVGSPCSPTSDTRQRRRA